MGPIAYSLCQKPVIGIAMFITSMCAFPPLIDGQPLSLETPGTVMTKAFTAPVDKRYLFDLRFVFPSKEAFARDEVVGRRHDASCTAQDEDGAATWAPDLGRPIPLHVVVRRASDRAVVADRIFRPRCVTSWGGTGHPDKWRTVGGIELVRGDYIAEVENLEAQPGLAGVTTTIWLVGGHGK